MGLTRVETSIQIMRLFAPGTPILASYAWLEQHLGALVPMEVVVRFDKKNRARHAAAAPLINELENGDCQSRPRSRGSISAATFAPDLQVPAARCVDS